MRKLLIANRAEIAIRVARAAAELEIETLAIAPADDDKCLHVLRADGFTRLDGQGAAAYLDIAQIVSIAQREGCDAIGGYQPSSAVGLSGPTPGPVPAVRGGGPCATG